MLKRRNRDRAASIQKHLDDGRVIKFDETTQVERIKLARRLVGHALVKLPRNASILELGCGAADISGHFSNMGYDVSCVDCLPQAEAVIHSRYPKANFTASALEDVTPREVDVLVLCETLEHVAEPLPVVTNWLPLAKYVIIGHPLDESVIGGEDGHVWSYTQHDFENWFTLGGHELIEEHHFPMAFYRDMAIGLGKHK